MTRVLALGLVEVENWLHTAVLDLHRKICRELQEWLDNPERKPGVVEW